MSAERIVGLVVPLFDPHWLRAMRQGRNARLAPGREPSLDPMLLLARQIQLDALRSRSGEALDERWTRELGHELGRARTWDWSRGPVVEVAVHAASGSSEARLLRLGRDFIDISPQAGLEAGAPIMLERVDPSGQGIVQIGAYCRESDGERTRLDPSGAAAIIHASLRWSPRGLH